MRSVVLAPIRERVEDYEELEGAITRFFREEVYGPLVDEIGGATGLLKNSSRDPWGLEGLASAIHSGQIKFYRGAFTGRFNSTISRALRSIGATWDKRIGGFRIREREIPIALRPTIAVAQARFDRVVGRISERLESIAPEQMAEKLDFSSYFDRTLFRVNKDVDQSLKNLVISPQLTAHERARISAEYSKTLHLPIQTFTRKETLELREKIIDRGMKGYRYETLIKDIEASYGVSQRKAKFLARQETSLLMTKFKQVRYQSAGSEEYIWGCVAGSAGHPVRHYHLLNKGKTFRWDTGAVINAQGQKKNPGQDYNCRCFARPIVRF